MALNTEAISKLGFGCMRFDGREKNEIDIENTKKMIDVYIEAGGNYFDTAWAYPNSEAALKEALVERYPRESYFLSSKCVAWGNYCKSQDDLEKQLQESLENLGVEYLDVYLMHNLGGNRTEGFRKHNAWEFMKSVKERGLAKHIGFSAHCTPEELDQFINEFPGAELVLLQVNYADWDNPSFRERECVEVANKYGIPILVMEPVKGGLLADPSPAIKEIIDNEMPNDSYATAALRFSASAEGVFCVLSGMNTLEMVEDNCRAFKDFQPLNEAEMAAMEKAMESMRSSNIIPCTGCDYCAKVCPEGIGISGSLTALNYLINFEDASRANYQLFFIVGFNEGKKMPASCIRCGACEDACPQNINILECFDRIEEEIVPFSAGPSYLMKSV